MNTPDTEWESGFDDRYKVDIGSQFLKSDIKLFIQSLLISRDTYWKERVRKEVEHILDSHIEMAKHSLKNAVADQVAPYKHQLGRLLQAKAEILDTLLDNLK